MGGNHPRLEGDAELLEDDGGGLHGRPVGVGPHDDADPGVLARLMAFLSAASMVLASSMVMVIGPTPPGTGVIWPATSAQRAKSTSPQSLPSGRRLIPTSMTTAPGLTMSAVTKRGCPPPPPECRPGGVGRQIPGAGIADGDRGAGVDEQQRHGLADDVGAADDHGFLAGRIDATFSNIFATP